MLLLESASHLKDVHPLGNLPSEAGGCARRRAPALQPCSSSAVHCHALLCCATCATAGPAPVQQAHHQPTAPCGMVQ